MTTIAAVEDAADAADATTADPPIVDDTVSAHRSLGRRHGVLTPRVRVSGSRYLDHANSSRTFCRSPRFGRSSQRFASASPTRRQEAVSRPAPAARGDAGSRRRGCRRGKRRPGDSRPPRCRSAACGCARARRSSPRGPCSCRGVSRRPQAPGRARAGRSTALGERVITNDAATNVISCARNRRRETVARCMSHS